MKCSIFYLKSKRMGLHTDKPGCENLEVSCFLRLRVGMWRFHKTKKGI